jgi:transcriptional regulator with XRE-family HTH domain
MLQILENIKKIRKEKGYSQEYIASKLEMTQSGFAQIERGER